MKSLAILSLVAVDAADKHRSLLERAREMDAANGIDLSLIG